MAWRYKVNRRNKNGPPILDSRDTPHHHPSGSFSEFAWQRRPPIFPRHSKASITFGFIQSRFSWCRLQQDDLVTELQMLSNSVPRVACRPGTKQALKISRLLPALPVKLFFFCGFLSNRTGPARHDTPRHTLGSHSLHVKHKRCTCSLCYNNQPGFSSFFFRNTPHGSHSFLGIYTRCQWAEGTHTSIHNKLRGCWSKCVVAFPKIHARGRDKSQGSLEDLSIVITCTGCRNLLLMVVV
jgi:hypothetical protein